MMCLPSFSRFLYLVSALGILGYHGSGSVSAAEKIDFSRQILPILSENCFHCHGPDAKNRQAGLRLDTSEGAFRKRRGKAVILPGNSSKSELVRRLESHEPDEVMPPPDSNRKVSAEQIARIKKWIDEGASWGQHWAFVAPSPISAPAVTLKSWPRGDIDRFILARLEKEGMAPAAEASRESWLRRVSLDLTGLPPTLAEIDSFLGDRSEKAHETAVDRLLASPRYGERMASDWLDLARYADTHGYQSDRDRPMWPFRDWVIKSFNRNQPFDEFITWQLAGDLLPNPTKEQRLATAFNRLHMQNEEGGIVEEEFRVAYVVDRVNTMGTAFLAMTLECSRCHDHKYDPISMKDFYSLFAFFQNIDESGQTSYFTSSMPVPTALLSTDEQDKRLAVLNQHVKDKEDVLKKESRDAEARFSSWLKKRDRAAEDRSGLIGHYDFDSWKNNQVPNRVNAKQVASGHEGPKPGPGKLGQGMELSGENGLVFPGVGHFSRSDPFTLALWLKTASHSPRAVVIHHSRAPVDAGSRGYEVLLEDGKVALGLHHMWPGNSLKVRTRNAVPINAWTHVAATYDGSSKASGVRLYLDGQSQDLEVIRDGLWKDITYEGGEPDLAIGYRFRDNGFKGGAVDDFRVYNRELSRLEVAQLAGNTTLDSLFSSPIEKLSTDHLSQLREYYLSLKDEAVAKLREELRLARKAHSQFLHPIPEIMAMKEMATPKPAYVLKRGAYDSRGEMVTMNTPGALPPYPADAPRNRLGLARWLTHADHPLTARVTVNRLWQQMFGRGLVETSDNFGSTGTPPSHPELLDWLARDFVAHGWDVKRFLKQIALSATYRQSAAVSPEKLARDPYNLLLGRSSARRLSAEMVRDQALFVSGLLVEKQGGPSVYPYQPDGLWQEAMGRPHYPQSSGPDLYRRSLYTYWKRTVPHPQMTTFDAADRSVCTARRQPTSTPLQALALLNDPQMIESARFLAQRMMKEGGATPESRANWAFRLVLGRTASAKELATLLRLREEQLADFRGRPGELDKWLKIGARPSDPAMSRDELAALASVALALLNHDGAVIIR